LPVLVEKVDGVEVFRLAQSHAIERYLAKKFDLAGSTPKEEALLDSIFESYLDIRLKVGQALSSSEEEKPAKLEQLFTKTFPEWFSYHEALLSKSNNEHGVKGLYTSKFSFVEIFAFTFFERITWMFADEFAKATNNWETIPNLKAVFEGVKSNERVGDFIDAPERKELS
ncbi:hypothetical protein HDU76_005112, partial [Blyttiomyces sp. JEL0837]